MEPRHRARTQRASHFSSSPRGGFCATDICRKPARRYRRLMLHRVGLGFALLCMAPAVASAAPGKHHVLKATPDDVQWGWLDPREKPRLTIESGDTVSIETLMHARDKIQKGVPMDEIVALRK